MSAWLGLRPVAAIGSGQPTEGSSSWDRSRRPTRISYSRGFRQSTAARRHTPSPPARRRIHWDRSRSCRARGRGRVQHHLASAPPLVPGPLPGAQPDHETLVFTADQRADPQPRPADARHQHVRDHLHAADLRDEQRHRAAHRARDLGRRPADERSERAGNGGAHGLDPARHGHPGPGHDASSSRAARRTSPTTTSSPSASGARRPPTPTSPAPSRSSPSSTCHSRRSSGTPRRA